MQYINNNLDATKLQIGAVMYGSYWCPHCSHQKELFGNEAWSTVSYVECSTKGFYYDANKLTAVKDKIEGFPTWHFPNDKKKNNFFTESFSNGLL